LPPIDSLKPGIKPPEEINVIVEIPKGSRIKDITTALNSENTSSANIKHL